MKSRKNNSKSGFTLIEVIITLVIVAVVAAMMTAYFGTGITQSSIPIFRLSDAAKLNQIMEKITAEYNDFPKTWSPGQAYNAGTIILPTATNRKGYQYYSTANVTAAAAAGDEPIWPWPNATCTAPNACSNDTAPAVCRVCTTPDNLWTYSGTTTTNKLWSSLPVSPFTTITVGTVVYPNNGYRYICTTAGTKGATEPSWSSYQMDGVALPNDGTVVWTCRGRQPLFLLQDHITANAVNTVYGYNYSVIENRFIRFDLSAGIYTEYPTTADYKGSGTLLLPTDANYGKYLKVTIGLPSGGAGETITTLFTRR